MKFVFPRASFRFLCVLCVLCGPVLRCLALDREAFSITNYDLNVQLDPAQHRLGARGRITLRNDTATPQSIAILQLSSSLDWRSIKVRDKMVQYVTQPHASDIDHTGSLSEAVVTLPDAIASRGTVDLDIAYEGVVLLDATRLTRIGIPEDAANRTDWDQIAPNFTALRGAGNVAWYPLTTEVANLSEGDLFEALGRWKQREAGAKMHLTFNVQGDVTEDSPELILNRPGCAFSLAAKANVQNPVFACAYQPLGTIAPALVIGPYLQLKRPAIEIHFLRGHDSAAAAFADAAEKVIPLTSGWFGAARENAVTVELPDADAASLESGSFLLTPLAIADAKSFGLTSAHQLTHAAFYSPRPWIEEGLAHFAQALYLEDQKGRAAALGYIEVQRTAIAEVDTATETLKPGDQSSQSLVNTTSEEIYRSKGMCVWWMLRDMIGDAALKKSLAAYHSEEDKEPSYMPHLIAAQTQRDLEWFFDDWVYRDRGLPDFKVESASSRKTLTNSFLVAVTVNNLGNAGAEVPVIVKSAGGEVTKRLEVRGKSKATIRIETPTAAQEVVVNDGSVPESDVTNNTFKVEAPQD